MEEVCSEELIAAHRKETDEKPYSQFLFLNVDLSKVVCCDMFNPETSVNVAHGKRCSFEEAIDELYDWALQKHDIQIMRCDDIQDAVPQLLERKKELEQERIEKARKNRVENGWNNVIQFPKR